MNHLKISYSCNDGYVMQTGISLISLLENNKNFENITIYLISKNISNENIEVLKNISSQYHRKLIIINFDDIAYDLSVSSVGRHIETIYTKIFFSRIPDLDKVFYIDSDTIVTGSLSGLWDIDLDGYYMGMVETYTGNEARIQLGMHDKSPFYNDGVALCNVEYCRKNHLIDKCNQLIQSFDGNPPVLSEGVINKVCEGEILPISPKYNMMAGLYQLIKLNSRYVSDRIGYSETELIESANHPTVIHFLSGFYNRPWNKGCKHPLKHEFYKYKEMSPWKNVGLKKVSLPIKLKILGYILHLVGPTIFDKLKKIIKIIK